MIYVYACLLLHSAGKEVNEENLKKIVSAAGVNPDEAKIKSLVASIKRVDLDEILKTPLTMPVTAPPSPAAPAPEKEKVKEEKEKEEKKEEEAFEGLASLFG